LKPQRQPVYGDSMNEASDSDLAGYLPMIDDIRRISQLADPVVRNLQITQCYHDLSAAMARLLPGGANWCTVATWASRQAGQSIRKQDLQKTVERWLAESNEAAESLWELETERAAIRGEGAESLGGALQALRGALSPAAAFERNSDAVARGNQKVFEEIGYEFARFLALFENAQPGDEDLDRFFSGLRSGEPPEGQQFLRQAFAHYRQAIVTTDEKARAELQLLANLEIGFHEQTRLQPEILEAMNAPVYDPVILRRHLMEELFPTPGSRVRLAAARVLGRAKPLIDARDRLAEDMQVIGRRVITRFLMTLELPQKRSLRLGQILQNGFPPVLQTLLNSELVALLDQIDQTPDSVTGTGNRDWSVLPHRMDFIADLFRAYHQDASLFEMPFTAMETADIRASRRPATI
jgi:hypothetical protein